MIGLRKTALALLSCLGLAALLSGTATADVSHVYSHSIASATSSPPAPYPVSAPTDVAVDAATRDVYVTDPPNHRVQKFDSAGNFILMFGKEVDQTTGGNVCTAASGDTCKAGASTATPSGFEFPAYLAVDNYPGGEGDVYVGDREGTVRKFTSGGVLVTSWGGGGQKDGSDNQLLGPFNEILGLAVGGTCASPSHPIWGECKAVGTLYVNARSPYGSRVWIYTQGGQYIKWSASHGPWLEADKDGNWYTVANEPFYETHIVEKFVPVQGGEQDATAYEAASDRPSEGFALDPGTNELYQAVLTRTGEGAHGPRIDHYEACTPESEGGCDPHDSFGSAQVNEPRGVAVDESTHAVYVANQGGNDVLVFADARPIVTTGPTTSVNDSSVTFTGTIDPAGRGGISECHFEYGFDQQYGNEIPCEPDPAASPPGSNFTGPTNVTATVTGLSSGTSGHYRLVAENVAEGKSVGLDRTYETTAPPAIVGLAAERLTETTADLVARITPNGRDTTYRFEYGTDPKYGQTAPVPDGQLAASFESEPVEVHLTGLATHVVYHYRLVAENESGVTTVEDHTFSFYPPSCPNSNVRQQTRANFLPDCRAYELVSPADAGGTQLYANGPNTGYATNPARFSFVGAFSTIPGAGGNPTGANGDLYVATRTNRGWTTRYVGWPASDTPVDGGPPMGPPSSTPTREGQNGASRMAANGDSGIFGQSGVITDPEMNRFLSFKVGVQSEFDLENHTPVASNAPRVYAADGTYLERWPTNLGLVPPGEYPAGSSLFPHGGTPLDGESPATVAPGGERALDCVTEATAPDYEHTFKLNYCPGDVTTSADLSHFVFATTWNVFAPGGQLNGPGSVYDNDTRSGAVVVASKTPDGSNIPNEPGDLSNTPLSIPAVSHDGSHILIGARQTGPCGYPTCGYPPCGENHRYVSRCPDQPSHLYMRVDDAVTYDVSRGHAVRYVGTDAEGKIVYFLSDERLTADDVDSSTDLYRWTQAGDALTLVSKADHPGVFGEPGNSDSCTGGLTTSYGTSTTGCGVTTYTQWLYCGDRVLAVTDGGNCLSDNSIAQDSGDIYFFSQEQLDGTRGIKNQENLYVFRKGAVHYVTTLTGPPSCIQTLKTACPRIVRMQVSPSGEDMAFVTKSPVTQYDNEGHKEMYRFKPDTGEMVCVSCRPNGEPPSSDVEASRDGLFMTDNGRVFFATEDPLVHADTNRAQDVYEYVDGRPQLITQGSGDTRTPNTKSLFVPLPGLVGVSANGTDVYFATYDTLVREDHNGLFMKFYDARTGGGFSAPAPPPPCAAADECHAAGSEPPSAIVEGTGVALGEGGNASSGKHRPKHKHKKHHRKKKHHRNRGASK
jgi:hypothetical protein